MNPELLIDRLLRSRDADPERICLRIADVGGSGKVACRDVTIGSLLDGAAARARRLRELGVCAGDRLLLCLPSSELFVEWFIGAMSLGAAPVPLPSLDPLGARGLLLDRVWGVLADAAPKLIVADAPTARLGLEKTGGVAVIRGDEPRDGSAPLACPAPGDLAFVQYTSGSTGAPKGIPVTQVNLAANLSAMAAVMRATEDDSVVTWLPVYHDMGLIGGVLLGLYARYPVCLMQPIAFLANPVSWLRVMSELRATFSVAPNFAYALCAKRVTGEQLAELDLRAWRLAFNGSEPIDAATLARFRERFAPAGLGANVMYPVYGLAEATLAVTFPEAGEPIAIDHVLREELAAGGRAVPAEPGSARAVANVAVGRPLPNLEVVIRGLETGALCGEREVGEIVVRGPSVTVSELATGDLGYMAGGRLFVIDRIKDLIKIAGRSYFPSDVERVAGAVEGVRQGRTVAFAVRDEERGTEALVVAAEVKQDDLRDSLREMIRQRVTEELGVAPRAVITVGRGDLPRTSSGKLMRRRTKELYESGALARGGVLRRIRTAVQRWMISRAA